MPDVVVIGAGAVGLAIAEELSRRQVKVTVFERQPQVGSEASWAAAGILDASGSDDPDPLWPLIRLGYPLAVEAIRRLEAMTGMALGFEVCGMLSVAITEEDERAFEREYDRACETGLEVERFHPNQIRQMEPAVDAPVRWGLWWPQVAKVDTTQLGSAYRMVIERQGGTIVCGQPIRRILAEKDRVVGVEVSDGRVVAADWVVNAAGAWAGSDFSIPFKVPVVPARGQIIQFRTQQPVVKGVVRSTRAYLVQRFPHQLLAGSTVEYVGFDTSWTEEGKRSIWNGAKEICSSLQTLFPNSAWAGLRPDTPDHLPILGSTPIRNLLVATGHFRSGIILAPLTGRWIADLITQGSIPLDLSPFGIDRFLAKSSEDVVK